MPREPLLGLFGHIYVIYEATWVSRLAFEMLKILGPNGVFIIYTWVGSGSSTSARTNLSFQRGKRKRRVTPWPSSVTRITP